MPDYPNRRGRRQRNFFADLPRVADTSAEARSGRMKRKWRRPAADDGALEAKIRMLRVPITFARPGMTLAMPVRHPQRADHVLLQAGYTLDELAVARLGELQIHELWIRYPGLDFIGKYVNPAVVEGQARIAAAVSGVFERMEKDSHLRLDYPTYKELIRDFLDRTTQDPQAAVFIQEVVGDDQPLVRHASNVCSLSLLMGLKLDGYLVAQRKRLPASRAKNVTSLGIAALLHDVGMTRIEGEARQRWERTQDEGDPGFRKHVKIGYDLVKSHVEPSAAAAVLHHHQRMDGSGFPEQTDESGARRGLIGRRIHVFARIIATADIFDRLRHPPDGAPSLPVVRALRMMQDKGVARVIDPVTYSALMSVIPPYPPGSLVTLSNGARCVVTEWRPQDPCRPVVRTVGDIARDHARGPRADKEYDLSNRRDLSITHADGEDVGADNFYASASGVFNFSAPAEGLHAA